MRNALVPAPLTHTAGDCWVQGDKERECGLPVSPLMDRSLQGRVRGSTFIFHCADITASRYDTPLITAPASAQWIHLSSLSWSARTDWYSVVLYLYLPEPVPCSFGLQKLASTCCMQMLHTHAASSAGSPK